jgi:DNA-binding transcriptional LysR family regulator
LSRSEADDLESIVVRNVESFGSFGSFVTFGSFSRSNRSLLREPEVAFGLAAPYEPSPSLVYHELFSMNWSVICPRRHRLAARAQVRLEDVAEEPLILYERGSTGRQHVLDAFYERDLSPRVALETTSTETIVSMVEAGLGVSIVPLLPTGAVTKGRRVEVRPLRTPIRAIHSGVLLRRGTTPAGASKRLLDFIIENSHR